MKTKPTYMDPVSIREELPKMSDVEQYYMRKIQSQAVQRAMDQKHLRKGARRIGLACGAIAISIYAYTIYSIRQERFLDELDDVSKSAK